MSKKYSRDMPALIALRQDPRFADVLEWLRQRLAEDRDTYEEVTASEFVRGKIVAQRDLLKDLTGAPQ